MTAGQGQTLIDVAVVRCGAAEAVWEIAVRSGVSLTDAPGDTELEVPPVAADADTVAALETAGAFPATDGEARGARRGRPIGQAKIGTSRIM